MFICQTHQIYSVIVLCTCESLVGWVDKTPKCTLNEFGLNLMTFANKQ